MGIGWEERVFFCLTFFFQLFDLGLVLFFLSLVYPFHVNRTFVYVTVLLFGVREVVLPLRLKLLGINLDPR